MNRTERSEVYRSFAIAMNAEKRGDLLRAESFAADLVCQLEDAGLIRRRWYVACFAPVRSAFHGFNLEVALFALIAVGTVALVVTR